MKALFASLACFTLFATATVAQGRPDGTPGPSLEVWRSHDGRDITVHCGPLGASPGALILLGSFDGTLAALGRDLPKVLVNSAVIALTFTPGDELSVTARCPAFHVMLQAVEVALAPFAVYASPVVQVGDGPLTDAMLQAARDAQQARPADN
jgi:hypothetical protein